MKYLVLTLILIIAPILSVLGALLVNVVVYQVYRAFTYKG